MIKDSEKIEKVIVIEGAVFAPQPFESQLNLWIKPG